MDIVQNYIDNNIPLDVLVTDMDWHAGGHWTGFTWDKNLFPNAQKFLDWCKAHNLKNTLNIHPGDYSPSLSLSPSTSIRVSPSK